VLYIACHTSAFVILCNIELLTYLLTYLFVAYLQTSSIFRYRGVLNDGILSRP